MYFEDEKDIINEGSNLHIAEDGSVSWEDILSDGDDSAIEFIDDSQDANPENLTGEISTDSHAAGGVQDDLSNTGADYTNTSDADFASASEPTETTYNSETYSQDEGFADDFDIDKQLEQVSFDEDAPDGADDFKMPPKENKKVNSTTLLLALLVAVVVMAGIYYYFTMYQGSKEELVQPSTQTKMDNMTPEMLEDRANQEAEADEADAQAAQPEAAPIPVVNDDNVDTLKPVEPEKPEKKQIITIIPTGRSNPFLPLQKYQQVDVKETIVQYDKVGIPVPPMKMGVKNPETEKMLSIAVSGIMYDSVKPSAIITLDNNDYFVQKGDKLDNYRVVDIGRNFVTIALGKNIYKANVGEEFKITPAFYGNALYIPQKQGGGRQYFSVSDNNAATKNIKKAYSENKYVDISKEPLPPQMPENYVPPHEDGEYLYIPEENGYVSEDDVIINAK